MISTAIPAGVWRQAGRTAIATFLATGISILTNRVEFVWYTLLGVVMCIEDDHAATQAASRARLGGTVLGGLVAAMVVPLDLGALGIGLALFISLRLMTWFGMRSGANVAATLTIMLMLIDPYRSLNWLYVFNRALDTLLGVLAVLLTSRLFWFRDARLRLARIDSEMRERVVRWLGALEQQLQGGAIAPPLDLRPLAIQLMEPSLRQPGLPRRRRLLLERLIHHGNQCSRLAQLLGSQPGVPAAEDGQLLDLAREGQRRLQGQGPTGSRPRSRPWQGGDLTRLALEDELLRLGDVARLLGVVPPEPVAR